MSIYIYSVYMHLYCETYRYMYTCITGEAQAASYSSTWNPQAEEESTGTITPPDEMAPPPGKARLRARRNLQSPHERRTLWLLVGAPITNNIVVPESKYSHSNRHIPQIYLNMTLQTVHPSGVGMASS